MNAKNLFIISGPSGAGEDSVINGLIERHSNFECTITTTTREMRDGEKEKSPYYFISQDDFRAKIEDGSFAEWAQHYNENYYGITHDELARVTEEGKVGIWKIDFKGVEHAKKMFPGIIAIFLMAESLDVLEKRIRSRNDVTEEYVQERMNYTKKWLDHSEIYDYTVINKENKLEDAIDDVERIIKHHSSLL